MIMKIYIVLVWDGDDCEGSWRINSVHEIYQSAENEQSNLIHSGRYHTNDVTIEEWDVQT